MTIKRADTNGGRDRHESAAGQRLTSAGIRATNAYASVRRHAERLTDELDDVTPSGGVPVNELDDEDSMVVAVADVIAAKTDETIAGEIAVARTRSKEFAHPSSVIIDAPSDRSK